MDNTRAVEDRSPLRIENRPPSAAAKSALEPAADNSDAWSADGGYRVDLNLATYAPFDSTLPLGMPRPMETSYPTAFSGHGRDAIVGGRQPSRPTSNVRWSAGNALGMEAGQGHGATGLNNAFQADGMMPADVTPRASRVFESAGGYGYNSASQGSIPLIPVVKIEAPLPDFNFEYQPPTHIDERPSTAASVDTFQQAQTLFQDFDGTHYAPSVRVPSPSNAQNRDTILRAPAPDSKPRYPPPTAGMVYYPAPVPMTLNLPKRLSRAPPAHMEAKRRTQLLSAIAPDARKSAIWLKDAVDGEQMDEEEARKMRARLSTLPPQLRASMFFETPIGKQEVEIKDNSAVATLDTLLDASTDMPVSAFTDHPFVGKIGSEVYKLDGKAKRHTMDLDDETRRRPLWQELRRKSLTSMTVLGDGKVKKKRSRAFSLGAKLDDAADAGQTRSGRTSPLGDEEDEEGSDDDEGSDEDEDALRHGPPTTLLAELQYRKAAQKLRSRTALSAFPNGMHSTLLELDAVAQVQKTKRSNARVTLAWEDPGAAGKQPGESDESSDEEDVPLGMLYAANRKVKEQMKDRGMGAWDRPLGLIELREREDNEPLSHRRARLKGVDPLLQPPRGASPAMGRTWSVAPAIQLNGEHEEEPVSDGEAGEETLAERIKRLKNKKEDEEAAVAAGPDARPISQAFSEELLGRFAGDDVDGAPAAESPDPDAEEAEEEEETLGQRRARLAAQQQQQAAQANRGSQYLLDGTGNIAQAPPRIAHRASGNLADLLHAVPVGATRRVSDRDFAAALPPDSLLKRSEETRAAHADAMRAAHAQGGGLVAVPDPVDRRATGAFRGGMYNNGFGGAALAGAGAAAAADPRQSVYANAAAMGSSAQAFALQQQAQQQQQLAMLAGYQQQMTMMAGMGVGVPGPMGFPATPAASTPNLLGAMGVGSTPNLLAGAQMNPYARHSTLGGVAPPMGMPGVPGVPPGMLGMTAAQQQQMMMLEEPFLDEPGRERIDAWRQSVQMD